jgi:hypothetical protein
MLQNPVVHMQVQALASYCQQSISTCAVRSADESVAE